MPGFHTPVKATANGPGFHSRNPHTVCMGAMQVTAWVWQML